MGSGIFFPICAIPFSIFIIVLFYVKGHIESKETKIYKVLIISNLVGLILELLCTYASSIYDSNRLISILIYKSYLLYLIVWISTFAYYIFSVTKQNENEIKKKRYIPIVIYYIFMIIILCVLPIEIVIKDNFLIRYTAGASVIFTYVISAIAISIIILLLITNIKKLKSKKYIPVYVFLVIGTIAILIQSTHPEILMMTYVETLISVIMYFTIENPDMKMIEELNIAKQQAEKSNRAKTDFLSSMSHEIRTPLNAIVGFNECIAEAKTLEEAKEDAKDVVTAANTLLETINGILDISKIEAGKLEVINVRYKPKRVFEDAVKLLEPRIMEKNLEFNVMIAEDLPYKLLGDQANLKKCVINLLTNAAKYTDEGSITFHVNCVNEGNTSKLVISVEDTGRGIKPENIDKLFTKFQRLDEDKNSTIEGTGLGLAITKQLIELMGGKIVVQSVYGSGSKFTIYITQEIVQMAPSVEKEIFKDVKANELTFNNNKKVLIVDDNALNLKVASKLLEKYNLNIDTVESGEECLDRVKSIKYDLILMDDMMPKMSGTETFHELKKDSNFDTPVIALTANALVGEREKYLKEGFSEYLAKPINREELERCLKHFLLNNKRKPINFDDTEAFTLDFTKER